MEALMHLARESFQNVLKLILATAAHEELADLLCVLGDKSSAVKSYKTAISNDPTLESAPISS